MENSIIREDITFERLDKDTTPINYRPGSFFDLLNMRVISDDESTATGLQNFKGNSQFAFIPNTPNIIQIKLNDTWNPIYAVSCILVINSVSYTLTLNVFCPTVYDFYNAVINAINADLALSALNIVASVQTDGLGIILTTTDFSIIPIAGLTFTFAGLTWVVTELVPPQLNLKIIGWVNLREEIYLLTTNSSDVNPGGVDPDLTADPDSYGQIWKLTYDKIAKTVNPLELIYNNILNFTMFHPIANPGGIEARYENASIQKIYWTDNFNTLRFLNVVDPNANAKLPTELDVTTTINHSIPSLLRINQSGGSLITGIHQIGYRLKNTGGGETTFSAPSNFVHITERSENLPYGGIQFTEVLYEGSDTGTISSKSIIFEIKDLDTTFDRIEIVSLVREALNESPTISIIREDPLPQNGYYSFTYTGYEPKIPITLNEYNALQINFKTVKTIAQKNNRLFPANIKKKTFEVSYDSRAFRFPGILGAVSDTETEVLDVNGVPAIIDSTTWDTGFVYLPANHDAIQDYNSQSPKNCTNFLYQPNSDVLGGAGPNVSYKFTSSQNSNPDAMILDDNVSMNSSTYPPYRNSSRYNTIFDLNNQTSEIFPLFNGWQDHHNPVVSGTLRGYLRDEMYRFGIVFYDIMGNPGFVNWIADIRMPHVYMPDLTGPDATYRVSTHAPTSSLVSNILLGFNLGVEFTFNFQALSDQDKSKIRGFSIVRVKRQEEDKHILGQGNLNPNMISAVGFTHLVGNDTVLEASATVDYENSNISFDCPEFYFNGDPKFNTGDTIDIIGVLEDTSTSDIATQDGTIIAGNRFRVVKNYQYVTLPPASILRDVNNLGGYTADSNNPYTITEVIPIQGWANNASAYVSATATDIYNLSWAAGTTRSMGNRTLFIEDSGGSFSNFSNLGENYLANTGGVTPGDDMYLTAKIYIANYKRVVVKQYGGNSYTERANNEYILCSDYFAMPTSYDINSIPAPTDYICRIYGGDTFVCVYDHIKQMPNFGVDYQNEAVCVGRLWPVESTVNIELRQAEKLSGYDSNSPTPIRYKYVFNKQALPNKDAIGVAAEEEFKYNSVYSSENDVKTFFPKPDPFIPNEEFDNRIYNSEDKINGEQADSWGIYKEANCLDVDGILGPINNLITLTNALLFFQDKGVGKAAVEERASVATSTGDLTIGTGGVLDRFDYITRESGSKHQFGFTKNDNTVWYFDIIQKTIFELSGEGNNPITDLKGLHSYFQTNLNGTILTTDNPYLGSGVTATYDFKNKEAVFTFLDRQNPPTYNEKYFTVSYVTNKLPSGDIQRNFISFYSYTPPFYINDKYNIFTSNNLNNLYIHDQGNYGEFYGVTYPCKLTVISNKFPKNTKILTNLEYLSESIGFNNPPVGSILPNELSDILLDTWNLIRVRNNKQNTDYQDVQLIGKREERTWNIQVPRDRIQNQLQNTGVFGPDLAPNRILYGKKMRDKYQYIDFQYNNTNNYKFIMHYLTNLLRVSPR